MSFTFSKYHGLGNDFIVIDGRDLRKPLTPDAVRKLCDRNLGIGADGILVREPSQTADHRMALWNADGSRAEISGNGLRCFVLFLKERGYGVADEISIETGGGVMRARLAGTNEVETTMPPPKSLSTTPLTLASRDMQFPVFALNVGNPHGVIFGPERDIDFARIYGPPLEKHSAFPEGANIEFVHLMARDACRLVVWERGAGITLACGSGSVATACAGCMAGHFDFGIPISVHQPGGTLRITVSPEFKEIRQRGPAEFVFSGEYHEYQD